MNTKTFETIWQSGRILNRAFGEYRRCLSDVYRHAEEILQSPAYTPGEFDVHMEEIPAEFFSLNKNIFSTLFQSMYHLLDINEDRRMLYGKLNHLFRTWVTSADNLLDREDKVVIPIHIAGQSTVMRQVLSIMTADRIMKQLLDEAQEKGVLSPAESRILSDKSLQILLPSAAEEASEEGGITHRPAPDEVLYTIHRLKTGMLFHVPFLGPETIEPHIDQVRLDTCKDALDTFGLGCQLLDDIRDMAKDHLEKRHNYVLSKIYFEERTAAIQQLKKIETSIDVTSKIHSYFPEVVRPTASLAAEMLQEALITLNNAGLGIPHPLIHIMVSSMFKVLNLSDMLEIIKTL